MNPKIWTQRQPLREILYILHHAEVGIGGGTKKPILLGYNLSINEGNINIFDYMLRGDE